MDSQREPQEIQDRISSPPPSYDQSADDIVLSLDETITTAVSKMLIPPALLPSVRSRAGSLFSRPVYSVTDPPSQQDGLPPTPQTLTADLSQRFVPQPTVPQPTTEASLDLVQPLPPAREESVLTAQSEQRAPQHQRSRRYNFSSVGPYSMVLHSPLTTSDTRPLYHISWRQDYFSPLSVVTTIRKGATEDGMFVAEFGLGVMCLRGEEQTWIKDRLVLSLFDSKQHIWSHNGIKHTWTSETGTDGVHRYLCAQQTPNGREVLAIMRPANYKVLGIFRASQLKVYPAGYEHLEEIMLCALILSRQTLERELQYNTRI